ncbi:GNAT family N-acetyltransferase [Paraburkholderia sediminicola]|uniref:GNAT family N-acetyltransferase n=1 Tax=Paraburkholderia sediminicola TaxID=458836 RepID=UPI0038B9951F
MATAKPSINVPHSTSHAAELDQLDIRRANPDEFGLLARMNRELIEDEGHRNPMTVPQLTERFQSFVSNEGWQVDVLLSGSTIVGFMTHRYEPDIAEPSGFRVFLRQFYISRDKRRGGIGSRAVELLFKKRFKPGDRVFLDVLEVNPIGRAFWSRSGFSPYSTTMEQVVGSSEPS